MNLHMRFVHIPRDASQQGSGAVKPRGSAEGQDVPVQGGDQRGNCGTYPPAV